MHIDFLNQLKLLLQLPSSEVWLYWQFAQHLKAGLIPYLQFHPEYPPFSLIFFYFPMFFSTDPLFYIFYYYIEIVLCIIFGGLLVYLYKKDLGKVYLYLFLIWLMQASDYRLVFNRFDIFPAVIAFFAFFEFFKRKKENIGWILLSIAVMTKIYPIVLFPVFLLKARRKWLSLVFFLYLFVENAYFYFISKGGYLELFRTQGFRHIQIESFKTTFVIWMHWYQNLPIHLIYSNYSWSLLLPKNIETMLTIITLVLILTPLFFLSKIKDPARMSIVAITSFMLYNSVLSPQYFIWLLPFVPFLEISDLIFFIPVIGLTSWLFSFYGQTFYDGMKSVNEWTLLLIFLRNALLLIFYYKVTFSEVLQRSLNALLVLLGRDDRQLFFSPQQTNQYAD